ncbi:MAG: hypothetical protein L7V86_06570 [Verrucomicrobiales bacterium]|nr:hypothetical protein [Verrucomicrobiales bacterium]
MAGFVDDPHASGANLFQDLQRGKGRVHLIQGRIVRQGTSHLNGLNGGLGKEAFRAEAFGGRSPGWADHNQGSSQKLMLSYRFPETP